MSNLVKRNNGQMKAVGTNSAQVPWLLKYFRLSGDVVSLPRSRKLSKTTRAVPIELKGQPEHSNGPNKENREPGNACIHNGCSGLEYIRCV